MKVLVMGAGGVGSYFGGMLARAGHSLTMVARPQHVEAINRDGLRVESAAFNGHVAMRAIAAPEGLLDCDLVLFCVKSYDTESAGRLLEAHLPPTAVILCLQNGVDNAERLGAILPHAVVPAVVYVAVEMAGAGHVRHHGRGELLIGPSTRSEAIARELVAAGIPTTVSATVAAALWEKLVINCAFNALSAIPHLNYGQLVARADVRRLMREIVDECLTVARRSGVTVDERVHAAIDSIGKSMATQHSSTAQDLAAGKRSEIDYLNGHVVRAGEALGLATPANRALQVLVHLMEVSRESSAHP